ncbi:MAG TPA: helix-turn-helix domain-containing protein, partial [Pyrinomonadaceae bacterium]
MDLLTTKEVAKLSGVSMRQVQALITNGRLPAQKYGRDYFIKETDLKLVEDRKVGRPKKFNKERNSINVLWLSCL